MPSQYVYKKSMSLDWPSLRQKRASWFIELGWAHFFPPVTLCFDQDGIPLAIGFVPILVAEFPGVLMIITTSYIPFDLPVLLVLYFSICFAVLLNRINVFVAGCLSNVKFLGEFNIHHLARGGWFFVKQLFDGSVNVANFLFAGAFDAAFLWDFEFKTFDFSLKQTGNKL